jgi:nicotinamide mononucleotide adenylyltransferase
MEQPEPSTLSLGESVHASLSRSSDPRISPVAHMRSLDAVPQGSAGDEEAGRARSRRLVSGYRFGNPPSPLVVNHGLAHSATYGAYTEGEEVLEIERDTQESDSPPLTEPDESALDPEPEENEGEGVLTSARRRSERQSHRGAVWGMDTLVGLNDGEADADDRAPKSEHPTQAYLRGEGGEAGMYRFPRHRLKTRMKGEWMASAGGG